MLTLPAGRRGKYVVLIVAVLFYVGLASQSGKFEGVQKNESSSFLPGDAESLKALEAIKKLPGGELAPAVVAFERPPGSPTPTSSGSRRPRTSSTRIASRSCWRRRSPSSRPNGKSALIVQPVQPGDGVGDAFENAVQSIRDRAGTSSDGLEVKLTGAAGYSLDAIKVFGGVNGPLLYAAASIVLILLIIIYRSPIFWIIPFFAVALAEAASRGAGYLMAEAGVTINGQTGGILPVLVFGAGTDYALLLVSRYREELRRHEDKHEAMRIALRSAGPAILASGLTVIAALLTLTLAEVNSTAGLGPVGAVGIGLAMISMLTIAARAADDLRAQRVLVAGAGHDPAHRPGGGGRDARLLAADRRAGGHAAARDLDRRLRRARHPGREPRRAGPQPDAGHRLPRAGRLRRRPGDPRAQLRRGRVRADRSGRHRPEPRGAGRTAGQAVRRRPPGLERRHRRPARLDAEERALLERGARRDPEDPRSARRRRARRRSDGAGVRPARGRGARQQADHPADPARRVRDPDRPAAGGGRAAAADRLGDPVLRRRARRRRVRLGVHLRLHRA